MNKIINRIKGIFNKHILLLLFTYFIFGIGGTFAYLVYQEEDTFTIAGNIVGTNVDVNVELIVGNNGKLVPMRDRGLSDAINAIGGTSACVDNIGNLSCQIYKITLTNNASRLRHVTGSIELYAKDGAGNVYNNLKWQELSNLTTVKSDSNINRMGKSLLDTDITLDTNESKEWYIAVWISAKDYDQNNTDKGLFGGTVTFETIDVGNNVKYLNSVEPGSYVKYTGNNGCNDTTTVNGMTACSGKNANASNTSMGYCNNSSHEFNSNGWRVAYVEGNSAYLVSAGATNCMCTNSSGSMKTGECLDYLNVSEINKHFNNLNNIALNYCNTNYAKEGVCDSTTAWAMNATDFKKITGNNLNNNSCYFQSQSDACGYNNDLINNGGYYWFATRYNQGSNLVFFWHPDNELIDYNYSYSTRGVRPILAIDSSIVVTGGSGTYEEPYTISTLEEFDVSNITDNSANSPNLDNGNLIPVYYDDTEKATDGTYGVWKKADSRNKGNSWYDYENKEWANAVIVDPSKKETYQLVKTGTTIVDTDIIAFYVWIPRYKYKVWNLNRQGTEEEGTGANVYSYPAFTNGIDIEFEYFEGSTGNIECIYDTATEESESNLSDKCYYKGSLTPIKTTDLNTDYNDAWYTHPAFTFDGEEKEGFWIGKFETTGDVTTPTILPNVSSLRNQNISNQFTTSKKFQNYLSSDIDAHMLTNLEWGAVAYLTHSIYGLCNDNNGAVICTGLNHNNSSGYFSGRSAGNIGYGSSSTHGSYNYKGYSLDNSGELAETMDVTKIASTTKNVTGIYDISGGAAEYVMGNMVNSSNTFYSSLSTSGSNSWNANNILDNKYYNTYSYGYNYAKQKAYNRARLGDATAEVLGGVTSTSAWRPGNWITGAKSGFPNNNIPWLNRGGSYDDTDTGIFNFNYDYGSSSDAYSFRSSLS